MLTKKQDRYFGYLLMFLSIFLMIASKGVVSLAYAIIGWMYVLRGSGDLKC